MAEVHIVDIAGEQWDIKDDPLTERVASLETSLDERITSVEENLGARITSVEESLGARITSVEESLAVQSLPAIPFTYRTGYSAASTSFSSHYKVAKIHFVRISISNVAGSGIGKTGTIYLGQINIIPKNTTVFLLRDTVSNTAFSCELNTDGNIRVLSSKGVESGNNTCYGELIFAEP